jgi:diguanylate cyclase (GGDEF)-like protein/PAS domain S-box-containing protein
VSQDTDIIDLEHQVRSRVLVVDDMPTNRSVLKSLLVKPDCVVFEAEGGARALDITENEKLDLVILDIMMPGMNGIEVLTRIRKRFSSTELPVLMLTVKDDIEDIVKTLELGANDYVTRPIDYSVLVARINTLIKYKKNQDIIQASQNALKTQFVERTSELRQANNALKVEVSERLNAEEQVRLSQDRYRILYDDTPSIFFTLDANGDILSTNQFGAEYLGYDVQDLVGRGITSLHEASDHSFIAKKIADSLDLGGQVHRWETCLLRSDSTRVWVKTAARALPSESQSEQALLVVCEDITETRNLSEQLRYQAKHDALTGLVNRYEFEYRLQSLLNEARRNHSQHALLYMDLDQFKVINDTCGHGAGDELLRQLAKMLKKFITDHDTLARLGGDEFAVLLGDCDLECATSVAQTLHRAISDYRFVWRDASFSVNVSIGVVAIQHSAQDPATLLSAADTACYSAKEEGPKQVHVYRPNDEEVVRRHTEMGWISKINKALDENRFELFYHLIVPVSREARQSIQPRTHYELLLRMRDEEGKIVLPGSFLPAAERYKSAVRLDRWVVENALEWLSNNPEHLAKLEICSINLSGQSITDKDFLYFLLDRLLLSKVDPTKICFELTETATVTNLSSATDFMEELRERGCRFALDDFGTGLSSFEYLKKLPVDFIKIDGQFIRDVGTDPINYAMVDSIKEIARVMSKWTIAEFVETEATLAILREIGVDFAQGDGVCKPQPIRTLITAA